MRYTSVMEAVFISRPNRFIANVMVNGREETVHVKNTGRCRELLIPGVRVVLEDCRHIPNRKTRYSLIAVYKGDMLVNMDSQAPNGVIQEAVASGVLSLFPGSGRVESLQVKREVTYGNSRFDLMVTDGARKRFIEVKGVTLEQEGLAAFPDAPTLRGARHLAELEGAVKEGHDAAVVFLVQMKGPKRFTPNDSMDPAFGKALRRAAAAGVQVAAYDAVVTPDSMSLGNPLPVDL